MDSQPDFYFFTFECPKQGEGGEGVLSFGQCPKFISFLRKCRPLVFRPQCSFLNPWLLIFNKFKISKNIFIYGDAPSKSPFLYLFYMFTGKTVSGPVFLCVMSLCVQAHCPGPSLLVFVLCCIPMQICAAGSSYWLTDLRRRQSKEGGELYLADPGKARGCSTNTSVTNSLIH